MLEAEMEVEVEEEVGRQRGRGGYTAPGADDRQRMVSARYKLLWLATDTGVGGLLAPEDDAGVSNWELRREWHSSAVTDALGRR